MNEWRDKAESELEQYIDEVTYYEELLDSDMEYQAWLNKVQADNLVYQMENEHV